MKLHSCLLAFAFLALPLAVQAEEPTFDPAALEFFEKSVRPILVSRCYECHSAQLDEPKGGLRLDSRAAALKGGDTSPAIVPGKPKESLLVDAINHGDLYQMPPKTRLPKEEVATLTKWVEMGAPWPKEAVASAGPKKHFDLAERKASHWCWQPIKDAPPPAVKNGAWVKSPMDAYLLAKLEAKGLTPNAAAEKHTLIRRAYFDLIGLPPTPEQVAAFVKDDSPDAFGKVVDELLKSPRFGERWARHWLDLVRYAESRGHEFDYDIPNAWQYRDYVIRAINADVPYDQFVTEHIAGDLVEQPRLNAEGFNESVLGTGFWHLGEWVHSPVDIRKDECDRYDNMVDVFSKTFLGLTVSCARCHDHKFDAISQKDYYALFGYLQSSDYRQARFDSETHNKKIAAQLAKLDAETQKEVLALYRKASERELERMTTYLAQARALVAKHGSELKPDQIHAAAEKAAVDADVLTAWAAYLAKAAGNRDDLFYPNAYAGAAENDEGFSKRLDEVMADVRKRATDEGSARSRSRLIVDYDDRSWRYERNSETGKLLVDGFAFGTKAAMAGDLLLRTDGESPLVVGVLPFGMARRDLRWKGLTRTPGTQADSGNLSRFEAPGQTLRTPTFEVTSDKVCYLVQGAGRAFAVVDSHRLLAGPLHGQTITEWDNAAGPRWIVQNLGAYKGHHIHVEFSPRGDEDLRVQMVVCGEPAPMPYTTPGEAINEFQVVKPKDISRVDSFYKAHIANALLEDGEQDSARWRQWVIDHPELLQNPAQRTETESKLKAIGERYGRANRELVAQIKRQSRTAPAMWDGSGEDERLLVRGNATTPKELVPRRFLSAIAGENASKYEGSGRLDLAKQVLAEGNPLTARVMANRIWLHLMGRGIVPTTDNFGVLGQRPSHPELLDHLAVEFRREGWSVKRLIRSIMLSNAYQMSSSPGEADKELDPQNLLWHRANIKRLEAEPIRDQMLALSGRFNDKMYGPSVPVFLTAYMQGRGRPGGGPLDGDGRRSVYISIRRNFLSPMMLAFDAPSPFSTMGTRNVSNVPAQALTLMNDPFVVEQAKGWAKRLLADANLSNTDVRIDRIYEQAFARQPSADERATAVAFLAQQAAEYKLPAEAAASDARVWSDLCHVLMNVKEFIFIP